jgi:hypothetical protein
MAVAVPLIAGLSASTATVIGTGITIASTLMGTVASMNAASTEAKIAENNAIIAEDNRKRAIQEGQIKAQQQDFEASQELGELVAKQAASGLSGTSYALQRKSMRELAARDRGFTIYESEALATRHAQDAQDYRTSAASSRSAKRNAGIAGILGTGSSLISGAAKYNKYKALEAT